MSRFHAYSIESLPAIAHELVFIGEHFLLGTPQAIKCSLKTKLSCLRMIRYVLSYSFKDYFYP